MPERKNRLADETSPYLLQHAGNPVDWYPWGKAAFEKAQREDRPIFISIGYSACHWCHVMERESFENEAIAAIMNREFVNIKVDREERPDLDEIYMAFVQIATGGGGWPMSVFLTPQLKPFFGGTYFPPEERYGRPGFPAVLQTVALAWRDRRQQIDESANAVVQQLQSLLQGRAGAAKLADNVIETAAKQLLSGFDPVHGGFTSAPKFPPSYALSLLMRCHADAPNPELLKAITHTLDRMADGGIYDQLGGGFHRYSVDTAWLTPHYEKMLYDNALLVTAYLDAFQLTGDDRYRTVAQETLDYLLRDMSDAAGGFHSAEDADSEGEEGKFYVWTPEEISQVLGKHDARLFCDFYGVTDSGNFEHGTSILQVRISLDRFARGYRLDPADLKTRLQQARQKLFKARQQRLRPKKDDKILADWNGLTLSALARGYQITGEKRYLEAALKCAEFIRRKLFSDSGLLRTYRAGQARLHGLLADYAFVANGLIDLYEASFEYRWLQFAEVLADEMILKFKDQENGGFFTTLDNQSDLIVRQKDSHDGALPAGNSVAAMLLIRLQLLLGKESYREEAGRLFDAFAQQVNQLPLNHLYLLNAYDLYRSAPKEIALVGAPGSEPLSDLLKAVHSQYLPNKVVALLNPDDPDHERVEQYIPLLASRSLVDGRVAAYVCRNLNCRLPVTTPDELRAHLHGE